MRVSGRAVVCLSAFAVACGGVAPRPSTPIAGARAADGGPGADAAGAASEEDAAIPISPRNPWWGSRTALVTIVEFADFECPFCARAEATLARIKETYGPETVRIVWKNSPLPFHPSARPAAEAAAGVFAMGGNAPFWKFHDTAFGPHGSAGPETYAEWARDAGVSDVAAFRAALSRHDWADAVSRDLAEGTALGVFGTPTFFVDGRPLAGALPYLTFQVVIDDEVRASKDKIAAGTPPDRVYAELSRSNRAKAAAEATEEEAAADRAEAATVYKIPIGKSPARGSPLALVTLIEFADYECPFCVRAEVTIRALREKYGDKLRVVYKDAPLPFHPRAEPAAQAAIEVRAERGDAAFWAMHDELLAGQADLGDDGLVRMAERFGARPEAVRAAMANHGHKRDIDDDHDVAEDFEASGTPHFFINGRRLVGAQPEEKFEEIIDDEMRRARERLAGGTAPQNLYEALVRDGRGAPEPVKKSWSVPLPSRDPSRGAPAARVMVHEWSDFECPFCRRVEPILAELGHEFGGKVKLVWHDLPLPMHADAPLAARAAREALAQKGDRGFWALHDEMFAHQEKLKREDLDGYARDLGLDMGRWNAALDGSAHQGDIDADREAAEAMEITGTPGFVIAASGAQTGYFVSGAQSYSKFRRLVERALAEAK